MTPMSHTSIRRHRAFTLLELILSMGIVAMITLALYSAMRTAYRARNTAAAQNAAARPAVIVLDLIQRDLESLALPTSEGVAGPFTGSPLGGAMGKADMIGFYTIGHHVTSPTSTVPRNVESPFSEGVRYVEYGLSSSTGESVLVRRTTRNVLATTTQDAEEEPIARGIRSFAVRYYDGTQWTDTWDSTTQSNAIPLAVEVAIELDQPTARNPERPYHMTRLIPILQQNANAEASTTTAQ